MKPVDLILKRAPERRILVVGDVMIDRWDHGEAATSQDGCLKFVSRERIDLPGGADNAARSISNWGASVEVCGHLRRARGIKTRYVDLIGRIVFRYDEDVIAGQEHDVARARVTAWLGMSHAVLMSDYDKGFLTPEFMRILASACREHGIPCVIDVKRPREVYPASCITKCNELWYLANGSADVITRGSSSPIANGVEVGLWLPPVKCVNHVGAGDCFAAHLALGLACGLDLVSAAMVAHSAARVYVQHPLSRPPMPGEVAADLATGL